MTTVPNRTPSAKAKKPTKARLHKHKLEPSRQANNPRPTRKVTVSLCRPRADESDEIPKADAAPIYPNLLVRQRNPIEDEWDGWDQPGSIVGAETEKDVPKLLNHLRAEKGVFVPRLLRRITRNGDQAIILAQILYWFDLGKSRRIRAGARWYGHIFLAKSHKEMAIEVGMDARRVKDCLAALRQDGLIVTEYHIWDRHKKSFIQPVVDRIEQKLKQLL